MAKRLWLSGFWDEKTKDWSTMWPQVRTLFPSDILAHQNQWGGYDVSKAIEHLETDWFRQGICSIDLETLDWYLNDIDNHGRMHPAVIDRWVMLISAVKTQRPDGRWGYFGGAPIQGLGFYDGSNSLEATARYNEAVQPIAAASDYLMIILYPRSTDTLERSLWAIRESVNAAKAYGKPLIGWLWPGWMDVLNSFGDARWQQRDFWTPERIQAQMIEPKYFRALLDGYYANGVEEIVLYSEGYIPMEDQTWIDEAQEWLKV